MGWTLLGTASLRPTVVVLTWPSLPAAAVQKQRHDKL